MKVRLLSIVESYPPFMLAGSEIAHHHTLRELVKRYGFTATVAVTMNGPFKQLPFKEYMLDGVRVIPYDDLTHDKSTYDLVLTQLYAAVHFAKIWAERHNLPIVFFQHTNGHIPGYFDLVVYNAEYLVKGYSHPYLVFHPPVWPSEYKVKRTGEAITRIGMSPQKGAGLFWELSRRLPKKQFLGVSGGWGPQILIPPDGMPRENVRLLPNGPGIRDVYAETRILIVPSDDHETWCRTAIEAMASGIVVIGSRIPALYESLGDARILCDTEDIGSWIRAIRCLDDPKHYKCHSQEALRRSRELHPGGWFPPLSEALRKAARLS